MNTDTRTCPVCSTETSYDHWSLSEHYCDDCATKLPEEGKVADVICTIADALGVSVPGGPDDWMNLVLIVRQELVR